MIATVADAVSTALVGPSRPSGAGTPSPTETGAVDLGELQEDLDRVAEEAARARAEALPLPQALRDPRFPTLARFHQDLRDALFVEIPSELEGLVSSMRTPSAAAASEEFGNTLARMAREDDDEHTDFRELQRALAELMVFEAVRLRLLLAAWESEAFERLGGEESDVDEIAWEEVSALLHDPAVLHPDVRPLPLIFASASVAMARDAADRADDLRRVSGDVREELSMRARLRAALRELRLPESVLLENALAGLLGVDRLELRDLQEARPIALEGLSRQAMDQRVSRGRRALTHAPSTWPRRRRPALFDLLRQG
jgi:hypothetical protein